MTFPLITTSTPTLRTALVCGAGGFIGHHLVTRLSELGYWVRGVDRQPPAFAASAANEFLLLDLRSADACAQALRLSSGETISEVFQLAAVMGGMGFIESAECEIIHDSALINLNMIDAAVRAGVEKYFFSSSACVYRDMSLTEPALDESQAYPAMPDNEYGWEKLFAERAVSAFGRHYPIQTRIARFQNCYGPQGTWIGGKEKAPAALCRKIAEVPDGGTIEIWGDGSALRSYIHVRDLIEAVLCICQSEIREPINIGVDEHLSVLELAQLIADIAGKKIVIQSIAGPVGVTSRRQRFDRIAQLGWKPTIALREGLTELYQWIEAELAATRSAAQPS